MKNYKYLILWSLVFCLPVIAKTDLESLLKIESQKAATHNVIKMKGKFNQALEGLHTLRIELNTDIYNYGIDIYNIEFLGKDGYVFSYDVYENSSLINEGLAGALTASGFMTIGLVDTSPLDTDSPTPIFNHFLLKINTKRTGISGSGYAFFTGSALKNCEFVSSSSVLCEYDTSLLSGNLAAFATIN